MSTTTYTPVSLAKIDTLDSSTTAILEFARALAIDDKYLPKAEFNKIIQLLGWEKSVVKNYIKAGLAFIDIDISKLSQIEPTTLFKITRDRKFISVVERIKNHIGRVTQGFVQNLIDGLKKPRQPKPNKPTIWRAEKDTSRSCVIPRIVEKDEFTGTSIQRAMDTEHITAQTILRESVAFTPSESLREREAYLSGALLLVGELPPHLQAILGDRLNYSEPAPSSNDVDVDVETASEQALSKEEVGEVITKPVEEIEIQAPPVDVIEEVMPVISAEEVAAQLRNCITWSQVQAITSELDKATRVSSWQLLNRNEREYILDIKSAAIEASQQSRTTPIQVGDMVNWEACYPHLNSWAPFKVQRIEIDGKIKLENVIELIPVEELSLVS